MLSIYNLSITTTKFVIFRASNAAPLFLLLLQQRIDSIEHRLFIRDERHAQHCLCDGSVDLTNGSHVWLGGGECRQTRLQLWTFLCKQLDGLWKNDILARSLK